MKVEIIGGPYRVAYDGVHVIEVTDGQVVELLPETCEAWIKYGKAKVPVMGSPENKMVVPPEPPAPPKADPHERAQALVPPHKRGPRRKK